MLRIMPIHLKSAQAYVKQYHRHNIPPVGGKFAISVYEDGRMCGVAEWTGERRRNYYISPPENKIRWSILFNRNVNNP